MGRFWNDLRHGARLLGRKPGFTAIAVLTLALGIGGSTSIFSVVYGVLLRPLPYPGADRIVRVFEVTAKGHHIAFSDPDFEDMRDQSTSFQNLVEFADYGLEPVGGDVEPRLARVAHVSRGFFDVMGVHPLVGGFPADQLHVGGTPMVLVSYGFWKQYLGGTPDFRSKHLSIENHLAVIAGVLPAGFDYPDHAQIWAPRELTPIDPYRTGHNYNVIGRVKSGTTLATAQAEASGIARRLKQKYGNDCDMTDAALVPLEEQIVGQARPALLILLGAVGLLLLVGCANVANLLLAQAAGRQRELAVRVALGATRGHLSAQFVSESLLLSAGGALLGLPVAIWGVSALLALEPGKLPRAAEVGVHPTVLVFAAGLAILTAVGLGLVTAMRASGRDTQEALKGGERTQTGGASSHRLRMVLMGGQVAVTLVLLIGAGLLGRSFFRLLSVDPGFRTRDIVTMDLLGVGPNVDLQNLQPAGRAALANETQFLSTLLNRLRAVQGVEQAGGINGLPMTGEGADGGFIVLAGSEKIVNLDELNHLFTVYHGDPARMGHAEYRIASPGYFTAMGIPLLQGRLFGESDGADTPPVGVISQSLAQAQWPGQNPIGKLIEYGNMDLDLRPITIVGVVGDVRDTSLDVNPSPTFYVDYRQRPNAVNDFTVVMHTRRSAGLIVPIARSIEHELRSDLPVRFDTIGGVISATVADRQFNLLLLGAFALTALILALMGVYGVVSYLVSQRTKEIGIRIALGAETGDVVRMVAKEGLRVIVAGAAVGVAGALALTRLLQSLLFGVSVADPLTFVAVVALIVAAGLAACYVPARRAARVDPIAALREQ
ncbi:MAG: ABC transporter permease [Acidobacteriota bacterium]|nr:ABC transporter permease [Acidobacteriota bacterium]